MSCVEGSIHPVTILFHNLHTESDPMAFCRRQKVFSETGRRHTKRGCRDKEATDALARKLEADVMLRKHGLIDGKADRYAQEGRKPIAEHLSDWRRSLLAKGVTQVQVDLVIGRATHVLSLCKADRITDLSPSAVQQAIARLRDEGRSLQTCNHTLRAVKQFSRWLWREGRQREDVLAHLSGYNVQADRRHDRRALTDDGLLRLIAAAESGGMVGRMAGVDRAMLYRLAVGTGFRRNELASLTPESFDLDGDPPTVTVEAAYSKRRRRDVQPIRYDLAESLGPWLSSRSKSDRVFKLPRHTAKMFRADLAAAGIEYRDRGGRVADFHALRHTYISRLARSKAPVKVVQELARHCTPALTLGVYSHVEVIDKSAALQALPEIPSEMRESDVLRATGTHGEASGKNVGTGVGSCEAFSVTERHSRATVTKPDAVNDYARNSRGIINKGTVGHGMSSHGKELGRQESNLQVPVPKTGDCTIRLLPNGISHRGVQPGKPSFYHNQSNTGRSTRHQAPARRSRGEGGPKLVTEVERESCSPTELPLAESPGRRIFLRRLIPPPRYPRKGVGYGKCKPSSICETRSHRRRWRRSWVNENEPHLICRRSR